MARRVVLKKAEIETLDSIVEVLAYREGKKFFVASVIGVMSWRTKLRARKLLS